MSQPPPTITMDELTKLLGFRRVSTFRRNRQALIDAGMPRPIPGSGGAWSRTLILAWIDGVSVPAVLEEDLPADPVEAARRALEQRVMQRRAA